MPKVLMALGAICLASLSLFAQQAKAPPAPPAGLKVLSATLDLKTHDVTVQLQNVTADKTAVAYMLRIKGFDAGGKEISDSGVGFDWAGPEPNPFAAKFILPGRISVEVPYRASADALSVGVSATGVVYADRTFEGLSGEFFATRSQQAKTARQALDLLKSYPATRGETRETMKVLLSLPNATHVGEAVANSLQLGAVPDSDHAPEQVSRKQWEDIKTELSQQATWYETESQPQVAKQPQGAKQ